MNEGKINEEYSQNLIDNNDFFIWKRASQCKKFNHYTNAQKEVCWHLRGEHPYCQNYRLKIEVCYICEIDTLKTAQLDYCDFLDKQQIEYRCEKNHIYITNVFGCVSLIHFDCGVPVGNFDLYQIGNIILDMGY